MQTPDVINHRTLSKECLSRASTFEWSLNSRISLAKMFQFHYWVEQWNIHVQAGFRSRAARHSTRTGWSLSDRTNVAARQRCMASISNRWTNQQKINRKNAECLFHLFSCVFFLLLSSLCAFMNTKIDISNCLLLLLLPFRSNASGVHRCVAPLFHLKHRLPVIVVHVSFPQHSGAIWKCHKKNETE